MEDVLVSYSRANRDWATGAGDTLEGAGHGIWWNKHLPPSGDR